MRIMVSIVVTTSLFMAVVAIRIDDPPQRYWEIESDSSSSSDISTWQEDFESWAAWYCPSCSTVFGPLFEGIEEQGYIERGLFDQFALLRDVKLRLTLRGTIYGHFARASRIPVVLKMDKNVTVSFQKEASAPHRWIASIEGLHTQPAKAGHRMYARIVQGIDECPKDVTPDCIETELRAIERYYQRWRVEDNGDVDVISHIFNGLRDFDSLVGQHEMSEILYAMITPCSLTIKSLVFEGESVYAKTEIDSEGDGRQFCVDHSLHKKAELVGKHILSQNPKSLAMASKYAKTGINFAKLLSYDNKEIREALREKQVLAANSTAIGATFTLCKDLDTNGRPSCEGATSGRIHWFETLNQEFT